MSAIKVIGRFFFRYEDQDFRVVAHQATPNGRIPLYIEQMEEDRAGEVRWVDAEETACLWETAFECVVKEHGLLDKKGVKP